MSITPAALEMEWTDNLQRRKRRTLSDLLGTLLRDLATGCDESLYVLLALKPHHLLQRRWLARYHGPLLAFAWKRAVLDVHPAHAEGFAAALELSVGELPGLDKRQRREQFFNDLTFLQLITDNFAEDGFTSCALHVVQRVCGEIERNPEHLDLAVALGQWLEEQCQGYRDLLMLAEVATGRVSD